MKLTESCLYLPSLNTKMQRKEIETLIYQQMGRKKRHCLHLQLIRFHLKKSVHISSHQ